MENGSKIYISQKIHFVMDFFKNPRPLYNSNMAKVSIFKWSQIKNFEDGNPFFGLTPDFLIALKTAIFCLQKGCSETTLR